MKEFEEKQDFGSLTPYELDLARELSKRHYAPGTRKKTEEAPVCSRSKLCEGCPYPSHGFICWHDEEHCLRSEVEKIQVRKRK